LTRLYNCAHLCACACSGCMKHRPQVPTLFHLLCRLLYATTLMASNMGGAWSSMSFCSLIPESRYSLHVTRLSAQGVQQRGLQKGFASKFAWSCNTLNSVLPTKTLQIGQGQVANARINARMANSVLLCVTMKAVYYCCSVTICVFAVHKVSASSDHVLVAQCSTQ